MNETVREKRQHILDMAGVLHKRLAHWHSAGDRLIRRLLDDTGCVTWPDVWALVGWLMAIPCSVITCGYIAFVISGGEI